MSRTTLMNQLLNDVEEIQILLLEVTTRVDSMIVRMGKTAELSEAQSVLKNIEDLVQGVKEDISIIVEIKAEKDEPKTTREYLKYAQSVLKEAMEMAQKIEGTLDIIPIIGRK